VLGPAAVACGPAQTAPKVTPDSTDKQAQDTGTPTKGGTYTEAVFGDAKTMQPLLSQDTASSGFIGNQYNAPLMRRDPETLAYDTKYGTAESYQISPDGLTITYKLKSNIF